MKYTYTGLSVGLLIFGFLAPISAADVACNSRLLIENRSGWAITLFYTTNAGKKMELAMRQGEKFKELDTCLDKVATMSFERRGKVWGAYSSKISLTEELQALQKEAKFGFTGSEKNKDGVIVINATMTDWNVSRRWESAMRGSLVMPEEIWEEKKPAQPKPQAPVSTAKIPALVEPASVSLSEVQQGKLGAHYAQKVQTILETDYAKVESQGKVNLNKQLMREFSNISLPKELKGTKVVEKLTATRVASEDAKNTIDSLTRALNKYRDAGLVK